MVIYLDDSSVQSSINFSIFGHKIKDSKFIFIPIFTIIIAELLLFTGKLQYGILMHILTIFMIIILLFLVKNHNVNYGLETLTLLPLLRLVNISMPVFFSFKLYLYIFIYAPLIIPIFLIIRHQKIAYEDLGFKTKNLLIYIPLALIIGYIIGLGEYTIIKADTLIPDLSILSILQLSFVMFFFVGLIEELIFRSLIQTRLESYLGITKGLLITSLMFGMMHSGYGMTYELMFTALAGLILGYMFQKTQSLPFVAITHGFINVFLFGVIPLLGIRLNIF